MKITVNKWSIVSGDYILTHKGFKLINAIKHATIRLFNFPTQAMEWYRKSNYVTDVKFKKVKITYELLNEMLDNA